jgi:hypothetical protein
MSDVPTIAHWCPRCDAVLPPRPPPAPGTGVVSRVTYDPADWTCPRCGWSGPTLAFGPPESFDYADRGASFAELLSAYPESRTTDAGGP